jgi:hypothetical protein
MINSDHNQDKNSFELETMQFFDKENGKNLRESFLEKALLREISNYKALKLQHDSLLQELQIAKRQLDLIQRTLSWKITQPLRMFRILATRVTQKSRNTYHESRNN